MNKPYLLIKIKSPWIYEFYPVAHEEFIVPLPLRSAILHGLMTSPSLQ